MKYAIGLLLAVLSFPAAAGPFVGVEFGPMHGDYPRAETETIPEITKSDFGGDFALSGRVGYKADNGWYGVLQVFAPGGYKSSAFGVITSGPGNVGDTRDDESARNRVNDSAYALTLGRAFALGEFVDLEIEAGAVAWERRVFTSRETTHRVYTAPGVLGPVVSSTYDADYASEHDISGTAGVALTLHDEIVAARIAVRHLGGIGSTVLGLGVTVQF